MEEPYIVKWNVKSKKYDVCNRKGYPKVVFYVGNNNKILPMICFDEVEKGMTKVKKRNAISCLREKLFLANELYSDFLKISIDN